MLEIDMEFRKGILFVRLMGVLLKTTVPILNKEVINVVKKYGIHNVVFNIHDLKEIDKYGIEALLNSKKCTNNLYGDTIICGLVNSDVEKKMKNKKVLNYLYETSDELTALHYFNI